MGLGCLSLPQCLLGGSGKGKEVSRATEGPIALVLTLVWHQGISEFMAPHVSSNIWGLGCTQAGVGGGGGLEFSHRKPHTTPALGPAGTALTARG